MIEWFGIKVKNKHCRGGICLLTYLKEKFIKNNVFMFLLKYNGTEPKYIFKLHISVAFYQ